MTQALQPYTDRQKSDVILALHSAISESGEDPSDWRIVWDVTPEQRDFDLIAQVQLQGTCVGFVSWWGNHEDADSPNLNLLSHQTYFSRLMGRSSIGGEAFPRSILNEALSILCLANASGTHAPRILATYGDDPNRLAEVISWLIYALEAEIEGRATI